MLFIFVFQSSLQIVTILHRPGSSIVNKRIKRSKSSVLKIDITKWKVPQFLSFLDLIEHKAACNFFINSVSSELVSPAHPGKKKVLHYDIKKV